MTATDHTVYATERSVYTPSDFLQWRENQTLNLTPKFQRRGVWRLPARSYFIDTLLRSMPVPTIYLRTIQSPERNRFIREVVDGQQRIAAVLDYVDGKYRLSKTLRADWGGKRFDQLPEESQRRMLSFSFSAEIFKGISDQAVLEVFSRLNTYSVPLNLQELRNGKFFGLFKQVVYELALEHLEFWKQQKIFTDQNIARMLEAELTSELIIAGMAGMQDKKRTIESYYKQYDDQYADEKRDAQRFKDTIGEISETFNGDLKATEFRRPPMFYTLYCVVYHHLFGLPHEQIPSPRKRLSKVQRVELREAVIRLSETVQAVKEDVEKPTVKYTAFVDACLRQTDNIRPRRTRFEFVYKEAF